MILSALALDVGNLVSIDRLIEPEGEAQPDVPAAHGRSEMPIDDPFDSSAVAVAGR